MAALVMLAAVPLMILNMLGGLVGGGGLIFKGEWSLVLGGFAWGIIGAFVIPFTLLPAMLFVPLVGWAAKNGSIAAAIISGIPAMLWTYFVVTVSCVLVFHTVVARPDAGFFHLLWGYSTSIAPWSFLSNKDKQAGNDASAIIVFFAQLGTVAMMFASWSDPESMEVADLLPWFLPFMGLGFAAQLIAVTVDGQAARRRGC